MAYNFEQETREAIDAGERALTSLRYAESELSSARNWGIFDILGGGFISTLIKHDKMDKAKRYMERARFDLRSFSKELRDVDMMVDLNISTNDFLTFADWFFDGFVADWLVQDRINQARDQVNEAIRRTEQILHDLRGYM